MDEPVPCYDCHRLVYVRLGESYYTTKDYVERDKLIEEITVRVCYYCWVTRFVEKHDKKK